LADIPAQLADALRDHYVLERELGRGGMATVYLARDLKHGRAVALKVLSTDLVLPHGAERFQREIRIAAQLQHPHILTVYDSGEAAGQQWFTMPFVEGESLRDRLRRERQLPLEDAVRVAREAAEALGYAHEHGVIHRDVKPENILLTHDGNTLVADFGIARAAGSEAGDPLTATGVSVGTPEYMSPEQVTDAADLDARSDIYSLGCVLYEMLAGEPPFTGRTSKAVMVKRLAGPAPSVRVLRPTVPASVDATVARALSREAGDRYATAGDLARALKAPATAPALVTTPAPGSPSPTVPAVPLTGTRRRRLPLAAISLVLGFIIGLGMLFAWRRTHPKPGGSAGPKVLAVLPFENLGDSADAYFADGITDELRGRVSQLAGIQVIARGSSNQYRHTTKQPQEIARELGADYLLTATVRWEKVPGGASRVRVSPELVDATPGHAPRTKWQQPFDAALTDVFQVQADIAGKVANALNVVLDDSERHELAAKPTESLAAYDAYLKGEAASQGMAVTDPPSLRRAIAFYQQAVALDSAFVPAWAELARAQASLYGNATPTPELAAQARHAAERAQALGPTRSEGALALGTYYRLVQVDNRQALAAFEAGLKLAPSNVDLLGNAGLAAQGLGRWEASLQPLTRAAALDPRSASAALRVADALLYLRRYAEAQAAMDRALALAPTNLLFIEDRAMVALGQGDLAGAQAVMRAGLTAVEPAALLAYFGSYQDLYWVLDDTQRQQLLTLPPSAFDDDRATWAIVRAQTYDLRGNRAQARVYADSARLAYEEQLRATPDDGQRHVFRGLALAYLGRKAEAIQEGQRAVALWPVSRDANNGAYIQHQLVRIYLLVGEPEKALDQLEPLLKIPYELSPGWLRIDPTFAPLKGNPRFEKLVAGR
jgi:eukaryotic-like serine/threonine-protein kinase